MASHFSPEEIAAAVDEALALGLRTTVDWEAIYTEQAVGAGVDAHRAPAAAHPRPGVSGRLLGVRDGEVQATPPKLRVPEGSGEPAQQ